AAPPEAAFGQERVPGDRIPHHANAQPEAFARLTPRERVLCVHRPHELRDPGTEDADAVHLSAVGEHLCELEIVLGGAHQTAAAREVDAVHEPRVLHLLEAGLAA